MAGLFDTAVGPLDEVAAGTNPADAASEWYGDSAEFFDNVAVDPWFQRPGELPGVSSEDSVDLPLGSLQNPLGDPHYDPDGPGGEPPRDTRPFNGLVSDNLALIIVGVVALIALGQLFDIQLGGTPT